MTLEETTKSLEVSVIDELPGKIFAFDLVFPQETPLEQGKRIIKS